METHKETEPIPEKEKYLQSRVYSGLCSLRRKHEKHNHIEYKARDKSI